MPVKEPKANTTPFYLQGVRKCLPTPPSPCFPLPQSRSLPQLCLPGESGTTKLLRALSSDSSAGGFSSQASSASCVCKVLLTRGYSQSLPAEPSRRLRCSPESCKYGFKTLSSPVRFEILAPEKIPSPHVSSWGAHPHHHLLCTSEHWHRGCLTGASSVPLALSFRLSSEKLILPCMSSQVRQLMYLLHPSHSLLKFCFASRCALRFSQGCLSSSNSGMQ